MAVVAAVAAAVTARLPPAPPTSELLAVGTTAVVMSSTWDTNTFPTSNCIDGDLSSLCVSNEGVGEWVSVMLEAPADVAYVAVYTTDLSHPNGRSGSVSSRFSSPSRPPGLPQARAAARALQSRSRTVSDHT